MSERISSALRILRDAFAQENCVRTITILLDATSMREASKDLGLNGPYLGDLTLPGSPKIEIRENPSFATPIRRALAVLQDAEWTETAYSPDRCPSCHGCRPDDRHIAAHNPSSDHVGHKPDCELAALIGAPTRKP